MRKRTVAALALALLFVISAQCPVGAQSAKALIDEAAKAMGGMPALRALKNQSFESEGKQFNSSLALEPSQEVRQISSFHYTLARDLNQPRLRLDWEGRGSARTESVRFVEVIDGAVGFLQEGDSKTAKQTRLHPGRLATRLRDEKRNAARLMLVAAASKSLRRLADADLDGVKHRVVSFKELGDEFQIYLDTKTGLPAQVDILEDDPLEGDSSYSLRYGDWRKIDGVLTPFSLRYQLNGRPLQEEQIQSVRYNVPLGAELFLIPEIIRNQKTDAKPIASQWILRRVAGNVSYQDFGRPPVVEWSQLANGVYKIGGSSHATVVIEMRDHVIAVEAPLYEARTAPVVNSIKERYPAKPIRYVIPTHHHLDHSGGIRAFMAAGATVVTPFSAREFYRYVAKAPHTRQPDSLELSKRAVVIESFGGGSRVLSDGSRRVEVYPMATSHAQDFVVVYLPSEKILIEADHISPRNGQVRGAPLVKEFVTSLEKLNLDIATVVGIHGDSATFQAVRSAAQKE